MNRLEIVLRELLKEQRERQAELYRLDGAIATISRLTGKQAASSGSGKRRWSAAARMRIAAAQKKRWAKWKAAQREKAA